MCAFFSFFFFFWLGFVQRMKVAIFAQELKNTLSTNVSTCITLLLATDKNSPGTNKLHHFYHLSPKRFIVTTYSVAQQMAPVEAKEWTNHHQQSTGFTALWNLGLCNRTQRTKMGIWGRQSECFLTVICLFTLCVHQSLNKLLAKSTR